MTKISCLVISRTASLLNRLLASLAGSRSMWDPRDEILCSWNGTEEEEAQIRAGQAPCIDGQELFKIAQRTSYHFSANINQLASRATGDILVLLNDDLILDQGSLDRAIYILNSTRDVGIVGARLRTSLGNISHAGLLFDEQYTAYNRFRPDDLGPLLDSLESEVDQSCFVPAVTGAFMVVRRQDFLDVGFRETFEVCGEDVALCLDLYRMKKKFAFFAASVTGIHNERSTRGFTPELEDRDRLSRLARSIIRNEPVLLELCRQRNCEEARALWLLVQNLRSKRDAELISSSEKISQLNEGLKAIQLSTSWKLTAPLRVLGDLQKGKQTASSFKDSRVNLIDPGHQLDGINASDTSDTQVQLLFDSLIFGHANRAPVSRGGIYRYASELITALLQEDTMGQIVPFCADQLYAGSAVAELQSLGNQKGIDLIGQCRGSHLPQRSLPRVPEAVKYAMRPVHRRLVRSKWMRERAQQQLREDLKSLRSSLTIFHTPFQSVPQAVRESSIRHVAVTVHDMLPCIHPEFFTSETVRQFNALINQLQPTDHVICVSECTRNDFLRWQRTVPENQVHVTPLAASSTLSPVTDEELKAEFRARHGIQRDDFVVLSLCTLEPRKNLIRLIEAFESLYSKYKGNVKLVLVGSVGWKTGELSARLKASLAAEAIVVTGHIADQDLAMIYSIADVFAYPSLYEGFGLPPLEAMQCGIPVVVGQTSSLPEVVGDAAIMVDPSSVDELTQALEKVLSDEALANTLRDKSLARAALFSWQNTARKTIGIYEQIIHASA